MIRTFSGATTKRWIAAIGLAGGAMLASAQGAAAQDAACAGLTTPGLFPNVAVSSAKEVAADAAKGLPAQCEVTATISPVAGSKIGVVYRLPKPWNGKLVGFGGGGWAGNVRPETAAEALKAGYASAQTDGGHPSPQAFDTSWVAPGGKPDEVALTDFAHRGVHLMTVVGKQLVAKYYGKPQSRAYFQGCSTGGRMALMEAQRYPDDYDGIIAGAPVYSLRVQTAEIWRDLIFAQPGAAITNDQANMIHTASLAACDAQDGVKDGVVTDPRACKFDPVVLQCKAGQAAAQCLTPGQVAAVRKAYTEIRSGKAVTVFPLGRGGENAWPQFTNTANKSGPPARNLGLRAPMFGDASFEFATFDPAKDTLKARAGAFAKYYEAADPDLAPFLKHNGKLIIWHGFDDPGPSPLATIEYYGDVQKTTGAKVGAKKLDDSVRLFLAPGVYHCGAWLCSTQRSSVAIMSNLSAPGPPPQW